MVNIVMISYLSITQLMNADENMEWERQMASISYGILALHSILIIFQLCHMSEILANSVGELEVFITDNLLELRQSQQQNTVCNRLLKFKGFEANGFFTLNHSMLTGMMANMVTYLVILVQFRQS